MIELFSQPETWIALLTLTALELVLGIDNIIFISILVDKLPPQSRELARRIGLGLAMFMRIAMLLLLAWIVGLTEPVFTVLEQAVSGRDLILISGGLFLLWKSTGEIHQLLEGESGSHSSAVAATFSGDHHADHHHRSGLLAGLDHHCGRHGQRSRNHDHGRRSLGDTDDGVCHQRSAISSRHTRPSRCWHWPSCWWSASR